MRKFLKWFLVIFICIIVLSICTARNDSKIKNAATTNADTNTEISQVETTPQVKTWVMSEDDDEMSDTKNYWAQLRSENYFNFSFPYEGRTYATLTVRYMKRYGGNEVYIQIDRGQIYSRENQIIARFDDDPSVTYSYTEPTTAQSDMIFISRSKDFINRCKKAKSIKIQLPIFNEGNNIYTFKVDSTLVWNH